MPQITIQTLLTQYLHLIINGSVGNVSEYWILKWSAERDRSQYFPMRTAEITAESQRTNVIFAIPAAIPLGIAKGLAIPLGLPTVAIPAGIVAWDCQHHRVSPAFNSLILLYWKRVPCIFCSNVSEERRFSKAVNKTWTECVDSLK